MGHWPFAFLEFGMLTRTILSIACLGWQVPQTLTAEPPKYKPIDAETVTAYKKIGGGYGGFTFNRFGHLTFTSGKKAAENGLPGFDFDAPDRLPRLPSVAVPFGLTLQYIEPPPGGLRNLERVKNVVLLDFTSSKLGDAHLKHLRDLNDLTALYLNETQITDGGLAEIAKLQSLTTLSLYGTKVTDKGMAHVAALRNLRVLDLGYTKLTDKGLAELKGLKDLTILDLNGSQVTDNGLKRLKELDSLVTLNLGVTKVTDAGLRDLKNLKKLTVIRLYGTRVTGAAVEDLKKALPQCSIEWVEE
jgi:hypothetical protein